MAKSTRTVTKASHIGGVVGPGGAVDPQVMTDDAVGETLKILTPPTLTQNTTNTTYLGCLGRRSILIGAFASAHVAPIQSGGTMSFNIYVSVAGAAGVLVATIDPQTLTADIASPFTLQAANDAMVIGPTDTLYVTGVASNNSIGTAATGPTLALIIRPLNPSDGSSIITGTGAGL